MALDNPDEYFKSAFCQLSEDIAEQVLEGEVKRAVIVTINANGQLQVRFPQTMLPSDVVGMLQIGIACLISQACRPVA